MLWKICFNDWDRYVSPIETDMSQLLQPQPFPHFSRLWPSELCMIVSNRPLEFPGYGPVFSSSFVSLSCVVSLFATDKFENPFGISRLHLHTHVTRSSYLIYMSQVVHELRDNRFKNIRIRYLKMMQNSKKKSQPMSLQMCLHSVYICSDDDKRRSQGQWYCH